MAVTNVGKSSFDMQQTYVEDSTSVTDDTGDSSTSPMSRPQEPLALRDSRVALVDSVTRKAAPLSDDIMEDLRAMVTAPAYGIRLPSSIRPPELLPHRTFKCCITVRFDDTDFQGHTNTSSYMRFALECAAQAVQCGFYSSIRDDVGLHRARKTNTIFLSESRVGDRLHVSTWQDEGNQLLLNFAISNSGRLINFAQIEFFDNKTFDPSELFSTHLLAAKI